MLRKCSPFLYFNTFFRAQEVCHRNPIIINVEVNSRKQCFAAQEKTLDETAFPVCDSLTTQTLETQKSNVSQVKETSRLPPENDLVKQRRLVHPPRSLAQAVQRSEFLRDLVDMGVNLHKISLRPLDLDFITSVRSWDTGPRERVKYLLDIGVPKESIAHIITENPKILKENLDDMDVRVNYLLSKKFSSENITNLVLGCPKLLSMQTRDIDLRLGYFQAGFKLSGNEIRQLVINSPWLISWPKYKLQATADTLIDRLGFHRSHLKDLLLSNSKIWKKDFQELQKTVVFLHDEVGMSHSKMVKNSQLLSKRLSKMKARYAFLKFMNRANFDPTKERYTPYDVLWEGSLQEFCNRIHTTIDAYELYLRSL